MKKIWSIMLALALVLGLSVVATPALADVTSAAVVVDPATVNTEASYNITFNITKTLAIGGTVSIEFPSNTAVPTTYEAGDVTVHGTAISPGDISVSGRVVTITLPIGIGAPATVTVIFNLSADITNPTAAGEYTLKVKTSQEPTWVTSQSYSIPLPDKSTYEFTYSDPGLISVNVSAEVDVTLQTTVLGNEGYDDAQVQFSKDDGPGAVTFEVFHEGSWHTSATYPPSGNFTVDANHTETISLRLTFDEVGIYTLRCELVDVAASETVEDDTETFACAGVSVDVPLNKGWNLMSLPIIPDDSAIEAVLADITGNVTSVWYYDPALGWQSYAPGGPSALATMEDGKAYWIDMKEEDTLTVVGVAIVLPGEMPPSYGVVEGWNMVGFKSMETMTAEDYLEGTDWVRIYKFQNGAWGTVQSAHNMTAGLGYWVAFSEAGTIYP